MASGSFAESLNTKNLANTISACEAPTENDTRTKNWRDGKFNDERIIRVRETTQQGHVCFYELRSDGLRDT